MAKISKIQRELIAIYENDFSKHNGRINSGRILMVFRSIVSQLAKSFEKYVNEHSPEYAVRFSKLGYKRDGAFTNIPLYPAPKIKDLL